MGEALAEVPAAGWQLDAGLLAEHAAWVRAVLGQLPRKGNGKAAAFAKPDLLKEKETLTIGPVGKRGVWRTIGGNPIFIEVERGRSIPEAVREVVGQTSKGGEVKLPSATSVKWLDRELGSATSTLQRIREVIAARAQTLLQKKGRGGRVDPETDVGNAWGYWVESHNPRFTAKAKELEQAAAVEFRLPGRKSGGANPKLRSIVRATYDMTQTLAKKAGVREVTLYRAVFLPVESVGGKLALAGRFAARVQLRPDAVSSWTSRKELANTFQGVGKAGKTLDEDPTKRRVVLKARVPIRQILTMPVMGSSSFGEKEWVVMGQPKQVEAWRDRAA